MPSPRLPNYIRSNRKRLALSQQDVAFLLGVKDGAMVCRYERFVREPSLETALAFEAIYQKPVRELFGGTYQRVEQQVATRARTLSFKTDPRASPAQQAQRRQYFKNFTHKSLNPS